MNVSVLFVGLYRDTKRRGIGKQMMAAVYSKGARGGGSCRKGKLFVMYIAVTCWEGLVIILCVGRLKAVYVVPGCRWVSDRHRACSEVKHKSFLMSGR